MTSVLIKKITTKLNFKSLILVFALLVFFTVQNGFTEENDSKKAPQFGTVETVHGKIIRYEEILTPQGKTPNIRIDLSTQNKNLSIDIGPKWILDQNNFNLSAGEDVMVIGATIRIGSKKKFIPSEIQKKGQKISLKEAEK